MLVLPGKFKRSLVAFLRIRSSASQHVQQATEPPAKFESSPKAFNFGRLNFSEQSLVRFRSAKTLVVNDHDDTDVVQSLFKIFVYKKKYALHGSTHASTIPGTWEIVGGPKLQTCVFPF